MDIRSDIPIPSARRAGRPVKYPWPDMAVGDSFAVPLGSLTVVRICAKGYGERHGRQFKVARVDGTKEDYRCWRIA